MRITYLGPSGTHTEEALLAHSATEQMEMISAPTVYEAILAVQEKRVDLAFVPIENSLEGSVNATLDVLVFDAPDVSITGEVVHTIHHSLLARPQLEFRDIECVLSHPQASAQCAHFLHEQLPQVTIAPASSTAEAARLVAESDKPWAALASRRAAELYNCAVLKNEVEDHPGNVTRFVWVGPKNVAYDMHTERSQAPHKTSIVFWGKGAAEQPGWLVQCLQEFASRGINLTKIESRPRKDTLGSYMFFCDLEGHSEDEQVTNALSVLGELVAEIRVLGSYPILHF